MDEFNQSEMNKEIETKKRYITVVQSKSTHGDSSEKRTVRGFASQ